MTSVSPRLDQVSERLAQGQTSAVQLAEQALVKADITVNKNMVPFDDKSPFITSGIRIGTAAITTRGCTEKDCLQIVDWIDEVITHPEDEGRLHEIKSHVNMFMSRFPLYQ